MTHEWRQAALAFADIDDGALRLRVKLTDGACEVDALNYSKVAPSSSSMERWGDVEACVEELGEHLGRFVVALDVDWHHIPSAQALQLLRGVATSCPRLESLRISGRSITQLPCEFGAGTALLEPSHGTNVSGAFLSHQVVAQMW